jgi:hypothetical protein
MWLMTLQLESPRLLPDIVERGIDRYLAPLV